MFIWADTMSSIRTAAPNTQNRTKSPKPQYTQLKTTLFFSNDHRGLHFLGIESINLLFEIEG